MKAVSRAFLGVLAAFFIVAASHPAAAARGEVYLLRGGANVFSTGMDEIAEKLRNRGVNAKSLGHGQWEPLANDLVKRYAKDRSPIVLVGHSWGANAAILTATALQKKNVPVALIVLFDPTTALKVPPNVRRLINYSSTTAKGMHLEPTPGRGFRGALTNIAQPIGHLEMDNWAPLQEKAIAEVMKITGGKR